MNLPTIKAQWGESLGKKAEKLKVRECDEVQTGQFVAYVDQGKESFDAMLRFSPDGILLEHQCDCGTENRFCEHRYALLLFLEKGKSLDAKRPKVKRKLSKADLLLQEVDDSQLRNWVKEQLETDKELLFRFETAFNKEDKNFTTEDVERITQEAIKSIAGRKTKIDLSQYTKIIQLFKTVHKPIVDQYVSHVVNADGFSNFCHLFELCEDFHQNSRVKSTKLKAYLEKLLDEVTIALNLLETEVGWQSACMLYFEHMKPKNKELKTWMLQFLRKYFESLTLERKQWFTKQMCTLVDKANSSKYYGHSHLQDVFWNWVEATDTFPVYHLSFTTKDYDDTYNLNLFNKLFEMGEIKRLETMLKPFLENDYYNSRNLGYLQMQRKLYEQKGLTSKVIKIVERTLPIDLSFEDYLWLEPHLDADSYKKLRTKLMAKARPNSYEWEYESHKYEFIFGLLNHEGKYKKMLEYVVWGTPLRLIEENFQAMANENALELMKCLESACYDSHYYYRESSENLAKARADKLIVKVKELISRDVADLFLKSRSDSRWYGRNPFYQAVLAWVDEKA